MAIGDRSPTRRAALCRLAGITALASGAGVGALAQEAAYPSRPVRFVIPFPPGSGAELTARFMG